MLPARAQAAEQALDRAARRGARSSRSVSRDVGGRRAVDEHREQREVVGLDAVRRRRRAARGVSGGSAVPPRATTRSASKSSSGAACLVDEPVGAGDARARPRAPGRSPRCRATTRGRRVERVQAAAQLQAVAVAAGAARAARRRALARDELERRPRRLPAAPTGTSPGSVRSSTASPARTAGWGSTMAMRVTRRTFPAGA